MIISLSDLKTIERCENNYFLSQDIEGTKNMYYYMAVGIKKVVSVSLTEEYTKASIKQILNDSMPNDVFLPLVKETNVNLLTDLLMRYLTYLENNFKVVDKNITEDINIGGKLITVSADLILEDINKDLHIVKLKRSEPKLTYRGRKYESIPHNNVELYALKMLGDKKYSHLENYEDSIIYGAFHHMEGKNDKKKKLDYESKRGHNIISCDFSKNNNINNVVLDLIEKSKGNKFEKTDDKNTCRTCSFENICNYKKPTKIELKEVEEGEKAPSDFSLTPSQREAVLLEEGVSRINAGAGSGKTTVVALRVTELIVNGCDPKDILMTTFTNKGAQEMRDKVKFWLDKEMIEVEEDDLNITTFNAWGDLILSENFKELGFESKPELIEKVEKYDILFEILENNPKVESFDYKNPVMNFRYAQGAVAKLNHIFDYMKANNIKDKKGIYSFVSEDKDASQVLDMYKQYSNILKERSLIEYQDQINMILELMNNDSSIMKQYDYKHIITDEFQDTDAIQIDLILYLSNQPSFKSLMVVGDDSQSIFGFRNTSQENILNFHKLFDDVKDIQIMENFRSTPEIVDLANYLNSLNKTRIEKSLVSGKQSGPKPKLISYDDSKVEYEEIAKKIKSLIEDGYKEEDIAVIARTRYELFDIQKELESLGVPQILDIPEPLLNNIRIHMTKNLSEFIDDNNITLGLYEYLMIITGNFENMNQEEIKELMNEKKQEIVEYLNNNIEDEELKDELKLEILFTMLEKIEDEELSRFLKDVKEKELSFNDTKIYLDKFVEYEDPKTVEKDDTKYRAVTLTTAHTSKGKEFKVVFNTITKYTPDNTDKDIEEERRLLFVSITRAMDELYITNTISRNRFSSSRKYTGFPGELNDTDKTNKTTMF